MPSAAWLAWADRPASSKVVLCDLSFKKALRGWTSEGSGAYSVPFTPWTHASTAAPNLARYLELGLVYENTTALALVASVAACKATPSTYYFDLAASKLYVQTSGSVNPDTIALLSAAVTIRLATEPKHFAGVPPYDAQIDGQAFPSWRMEQAEPLAGISSFPDGSISFLNLDTFWDTLAVDPWIWTNATMTFRIGGDDLAFADYETTPVAQVARTPAAGSARAVFQLRSQSNALDRAFPQNTYNDFFGGSMHLWDSTSIGGIYAPMWWGTGYDLPILASDLPGTGGRTRCVVIDPLQLGSSGNKIEILAVRAYPKAGGAPTTVTDYLYPGGGHDYHVDIDAALLPIDYDFRIDARRVDVSGVAHLNTFGAIAADLLGYCGVPAAAIDTAAFAQASLDAPQVLGVFVPGGSGVEILTTGAELIDRLLPLCSVYQGNDGVWRPLVWDPSFTYASLDVYDESDLLAFEPSGDVTEPTIARVAVRYAHQVGLDAWSEASASSTAATAAQGGTKTLNIDATVTTEADARTLAQRLLLIGASSTQAFAISVGPRLMASHVQSKLRISRTRGPSATGVFDQVLEVQSLTKRLADGRVDAVVGNQRGLGMAIKVIAPDGTPDWSAASAAQKAQYIFIVDDTTQRASAGDATSYQPGLTW